MALHVMDNLHNRLKVELGRKNEIVCDSEKECLAKYGGEML